MRVNARIGTVTVTDMRTMRIMNQLRRPWEKKVAFNDLLISWICLSLKRF
jgi:hypothetical protein